MSSANESNDVQILLDNKREMFDGMRAYHQSEISHTSHAITVLLAIGAAGGSLGVALLSKDAGVKDPKLALGFLSFGVSLFAIITALVATSKIRKDNKRYREFRDEYFETCKKLPALKELKEGKGEQSSAGHIWTTDIIWTLALVIIIASIFLTVAVASEPCRVIKSQTPWGRKESNTEDGWRRHLRLASMGQQPR